MTKRVHAPAGAFSGEVGGLTFTRGVAEVDVIAPSVLLYLQRRRYRIEDVTPEPAIEVEADDEPAADKAEGKAPARRTRRY